MDNEKITFSQSDFKLILGQYVSQGNIEDTIGLLAILKESLNIWGIARILESDNGSVFGYALKRHEHMLPILTNYYIREIINTQPTNLSIEHKTNKLSSILISQLEELGLNYQQLSHNTQRTLYPWLLQNDTTPHDIHSGYDTLHDTPDPEQDLSGFQIPELHKDEEDEYIVMGNSSNT